MDPPAGEPAAIPLQDMNPKQRAKEFKNTQKDLRSKDPIVRMNAAQKLSNDRYISEGGCLLPLLNSIVPKKVINCAETGSFLLLLIAYLEIGWSGCLHLDLSFTAIIRVAIQGS